MKKEMKVVSITDTKARFSKLMNKAANGEAFIIAKRGKPLVKVVPVEDSPKKRVQRIGFLQGQFNVPEDFDTMMKEEIEKLFYGED